MDGRVRDAGSIIRRKSAVLKAVLKENVEVRFTLYILPVIISYDLTEGFRWDYMSYHNIPAHGF